jgi:hypothetical protein
MPSTWYLKQGQRELGPLSIGQLCWLAQRGRLKRSNLVRAENSSKWEKLVDVDELSLVWEQLRDRKELSSSARAKDRRWRDADEDEAAEAATRSARRLRASVPMKAPPKQQTPMQDVRHRRRGQPTGRGSEDAYSRHRLAKWRDRRSKSGTLGGLICLILVGMVFAGGGAWLTSRMIHRDVTDSQSEHSSTEDAVSTPAEHSREQVAEDDLVEKPLGQVGLELRLNQVPSWIQAGRTAAESSGRTRLEITDVWKEPYGDPDSASPFKLVFKLRVTNLDDETRQYRSWNLASLDGTLLLDESDRSHRMVPLSEDTRIERKAEVQWSPRGTPGASLTDTLVFGVGDDLGNELRLVLPLEATGDVGYVGFKVNPDRVGLRPPNQIRRRNVRPGSLLRQTQR